MSTIAPKWSNPGTPPPKVILPEGKTAPRLGGSQKPLSRGFVSNLKDFLTERPIKINKNVRGDVFTVEEYGGGLTENFKEWFKPTPKAVSSRMTVDWQPAYKVMWQNVRDLISAGGHLQYDPHILRITNIAAGDLPQQNGSALQPSKNILNDSGTADFSLSRAPGDGATSGTGNLVSIVFQAVGRGNTSIALSGLALAGPNGQPVASNTPPALAVNVR